MDALARGASRALSLIHPAPLNTNRPAIQVEVHGFVSQPGDQVKYDYLEAPDI
jgi:hypothetical protein